MPEQRHRRIATAQAPPGKRHGAKFEVQVLVRPAHRSGVAGIAGQADAARAINDSLLPLHAAMFVEANPIPVKWAVEQLGLIQSGIRLPLTRLSAQYHPQVKSALQSAGLL